eukprot:4205400-Prymnesium_polylepis.1
MFELAHAGDERGHADITDVHQTLQPQRLSATEMSGAGKENVQNRQSRRVGGYSSGQDIKPYSSAS